MTISKFWVSVALVTAALAILAPDSQIGGTIRDTFSQLRNSGGSFLDQIGEGSQETGDFFQE